MPCRASPRTRPPRRASSVEQSSCTRSRRARCDGQRRRTRLCGDGFATALRSRRGGGWTHRTQRYSGRDRLVRGLSRARVGILRHRRVACRGRRAQPARDVGTVLTTDSSSGPAPRRVRPRRRRASVEHTHAAPLGLDQTCPPELGQVVTHRRFGQIQRASEFAAVLLPVGRTEQQRHQFHSDRIGKGFEPQGDLQRIGIAHRTGRHRRTAHRRGHVDHRQSLGHPTSMAEDIDLRQKGWHSDVTL